MTYIVIDTETTGLPEKNQMTGGWCSPNKTEYYDKARLVQIAWIIPGCVQKEYNIKPDGFVVPPESTAIHKVSHEMAVTTGRRVKGVLKELFADIISHDVDKFVAHNCIFDFNIVASELFRADLKTCWQKLGKMKMECTMLRGTDMCKLPKKYGHGYKWPSLIELYSHLFNETVEAKHNALYDTQLCYKCYTKLIPT